jgi:hypothetical protein
MRLEPGSERQNRYPENGDFRGGRKVLTAWRGCVEGLNSGTVLRPKNVTPAKAGVQLG